MEGLDQPAAKRARTDGGGGAAAAADPFAALFEPGTAAAITAKLRNSERVKIEWRGKEEELLRELEKKYGNQDGSPTAGAGQPAPKKMSSFASRLEERLRPKKF